MTDVRGGEQDRTAQAIVRMEPAGTGQDAAWLTITSWQGDGLHVDRLQPVGPDTYRSTEPMPLHGNWKTMVRWHDGRAMVAIPIYMPADPALGLPEIPAEPEVTRDSQPEWQVLQRETKHGVPSWLWVVSSMVVLVCSLTLLISLGWGAQRVSRVGRTGEPDGAAEPLIGVGARWTR